MTDPKPTLPPLPTPTAWNCYWKGDNDSTSWDQWHDASDPMPQKWDSDPPDEVTPHYTADQMRAYARAALDTAVAAERASRQAAQAQIERLQSELAHSGVEQRRAVAAERERCAKVCENASSDYASQSHSKFMTEAGKALMANAAGWASAMAAAIRAEPKDRHEP